MLEFIDEIMKIFDDEHDDDVVECVIEFTPLCIMFEFIANFIPIDYYYCYQCLKSDGSIYEI
jgi:hypothetical protein